MYKLEFALIIHGILLYIKEPNHKLDELAVSCTIFDTFPTISERQSIMFAFQAVYILLQDPLSSPRGKSVSTNSGN